MNGTVYNDKNGKEICVGNTVMFKGDEYEVNINPFNQLPVIDNDCGQCNLSEVHSECEIFKLHILYTAEDFKGKSTEELESDRIYELVVESGLSICKICGEYEAGLDRPCKVVSEVK